MSNDIKSSTKSNAYPDSFLECMECSERYPYHNSTASTFDGKMIFCSQQCEETFDEKLREGNAIMDSAQKEDPLAFVKTNRPNMTTAEIAKLTESPSVTEAEKIVDNMFTKLGIKF